VLKQFFGVLKGQDVSGALRLVFITGVSKFTRVSIFSDLNNLDDLTMQEPYSTLLGYTQSELEYSFDSYIKRISEKNKLGGPEYIESLRIWYNGYRFTKGTETVYNPYSVLNALKQEELKNFWFETGTPTFLVDIIKEKNYPVVQIEDLQLTETSFTTYDIDRLSLEALLFQTGYITIHGFNGLLYSLGYPNQEVKVSFLNLLYNENVQSIDSTQRDQFVLLHKHLAQQKLDDFIFTVNAILSAIPYTQISGQDEAYYHTVFYLMLAASGALVFTEVLTSQGRMDMAVEFKDKVYIIELKCNQNAGKAIRQIREKNYADKYRVSGREINLIGINFSTKKRKISGWKWEKD
jgi:hypothetical protein